MALAQCGEPCDVILHRYHATMGDNQDQIIKQSSVYRQHSTSQTGDESAARQVPRPSSSDFSSEPASSAVPLYGQPQDAPGTVPSAAGVPDADAAVVAGGTGAYASDGRYDAGSRGRQPAGEGQAPAWHVPAQQSGQGAFVQNPYPYGQQQQGYPNTGQGYMWPPQPAYRQMYPNQSWNVLTIVGFVFAVVSPLAGLVLSIIALVMVRKSGEKSRGLAIAGIIVGAINVIIVMLIALALMSSLSQSVSDGGMGDGQADEPMICISGQCQTLPGTGLGNGGLAGGQNGDGVTGGGASADGGDGWFLGNDVQGEDGDGYDYGELGGTAAALDGVYVLAVGA